MTSGDVPGSGWQMNFEAVRVMPSSKTLIKHLGRKVWAHVVVFAGFVLYKRTELWWGLRHTRPTCGSRTPTAPCVLEPDGEGGGGEGITHRTRTRLSLFFFVTSHHEMCPTGNLTTRWGKWRELLWPGRIENLSLLPRWLSTNSR